MARRPAILASERRHSHHRARARTVSVVAVRRCRGVCLLSSSIGNVTTSTFGVCDWILRCDNMRVVIGSYPQQNLLRDAAEGCPRARARPRGRRGPPRAATLARTRFVLSRRNRDRPHTPHGRRGPGRGAARHHHQPQSDDHGYLLVPTTVRVPSDPAVLAVRCRIDREQARQTSTVRTRHTRRRVFESDRVAQGVATDRSAVRRASRSVVRAPRPRCRGRAPRPRPSASRRRRPSAVASGALRPHSAGGAGPPRAVGARTPGRTVGSAVERALDLRARCRRGIRSY